MISSHIIQRFTISTPIGNIHAEVQGDALIQLELSDHHLLAKEATLSSDAENIQQQLTEYVAGSRKSFSFPLHMSGTSFQRVVWQCLQEIPFGTTRTYGEIAAAIGRPKAVRAVGTAIGKNPLPIVVPCHRVVAAQGLGGFSGGMYWKRWLLSHEGILT